jgi:hypothetical protein
MTSGKFAEYYEAQTRFLLMLDEMLASEQWYGRFTDADEYFDCEFLYPSEQLPDYWDVRGHAIPLEEMLCNSCCSHCDGLHTSGGYWEPEETSCCYPSCRQVGHARHVLRMLGINPYDYDIDMTQWW